MKERHFIFLITLILSIHTLKGQKSSFTDDFQNRNIDPRQYIRVYTINKLDNKELIWEYNRDDSKGNQRLKIIDASSNIQIEFDKSEIASNPLFKGNISIEGKIVSSKGGEDPIEVYPYSKIGEEKRKVGITSRPPNEIAKIFVNLLLSSFEATEIEDELGINELDIITFNTDLKSFIDDLEKLPPNESHFGNLSQIDNRKDDVLFGKLDRLIYLMGSFGFHGARLPSSIYGAREFKAIPNSELQKGFIEFSNVLQQFFVETRKKNNAIFPERINQLNSKIKIIIEYINYFKSSGEKAEDAFLSLIQLDHIGLDNIEVNLIDINKEINTFFSQQDPNFVIKSKNNDGFLIRDYNNINVTERVKSVYLDGIEEIKKLTRIRGTEIENFLFSDEIYPKSSEDEYRELLSNRKDLINDLATKASEIIYLNLDYATINLKKERAQEGDYLYIYAVLEESSRRSNGDKNEVVQKVLPIGSYELRKTGWQVKIADSFLLINRIDEPNSDTNTDVSPSNFKGSPGVSLLLTRRRNSDKNSIFNFLEPSFGVNVSYMDFSRNDDVEIGAGLVLGFFNNKIFLTSGINLNSTGGNENDPYYFGIGFSFANLAAKLLEKN